MKLKTPTFPSRGHDRPGTPHHHTPGVLPGAAPSGVASFSPPPPATGAASSRPVSPLKKVAGGLTAPARQRNTAVMVAGLVFVILAGAIGASVAASFDDSLDVLVAAGPIAEGQAITADDFRVVQIAAAAGDIQAVAPDSIDSLIGRVAAGPIGAGSMIHPEQFVDPTQEATVIVGAALGPNQYPANGLKPGDRVRLIEVADEFDVGDDEDAGFVSGREIGLGEIVGVVRLGQADQLHFAIRVGESTANLVAQRVSQEQLSLALIDDGITIQQVEPLDPADAVVPLELDDETEEPAE